MESAEYGAAGEMTTYGNKAGLDSWRRMTLNRLRSEAQFLDKHDAQITDLQGQIADLKCQVADDQVQITDLHRGLRQRRQRLAP
jgi:hypothetical protein